MIITSNKHICIRYFSFDSVLKSKIYAVLVNITEEREGFHKLNVRQTVHLNSVRAETAQGVCGSAPSVEVKSEV